MSTRSWKKTCVVLLFSAACGLGGYQYYISTQNIKDFVPLETTSVAYREIKSSVSATGTIEPINSVAVSSKISARIKEVLVKENDVVSVGQVVAILDGKEYEVKRNKAEFNVNNTRMEYERVLRLHGIGAKSDKELQTAALNYNTAQSDLAEAESDLAETVIRAPMNGIVIGETKNVGSMALQGSDYPTVIMRIADLSSKQIKAKIDETDIGSVKIGQTAIFSVDAYAGKKFTATVARISKTDVNNSWDSTSTGNSSSTSSSSVIHYYVTLDVDDPEELLLPAMTARVDIITAEKPDALTLEVSALQTDSKGSYVTLVHPDQTTEIRYVKTGIYSDEYVEIVDGLSVGDSVLDSYAEDDDSNKNNESPFVF